MTHGFKEIPDRPSPSDNVVVDDARDAGALVVADPTVHVAGENVVRYDEVVGRIKDQREHSRKNIRF